MLQHVALLFRAQPAAALEATVWECVGASAAVRIAGHHGIPRIVPLQGERQVFAKTPEGTTFSAKSFSDLHLSRPLIRACQALGYQHPTPIQVGICPPLLLAGQGFQPVGPSADGLAAMMRLMDSPLLALFWAVSITIPSLSCHLCA